MQNGAEANRDRNVHRVSSAAAQTDRVGNVGESVPTANRQTQATPALESGIAQTQVLGKDSDRYGRY